MTAKIAEQDGTEATGTALATGGFSSKDVTDHTHLGIPCSIEMIDPSLLDVSEYNLRKNESKEDEINSSKTRRMIKDVGIMNPLVVTPSYKVIAGKRRLGWAREGKNSKVLVHRLHQEPSPRDTLVISFHENAQRKQLSLNERLDYVRLMLKICDHGQGKQRLMIEVANLMHVQKASIYNLLYLADLRGKYPDITSHLGIEKALALSKILETPRFKSASEEEIRSLVIRAKSVPAKEIRLHPDRLIENAEDEENAEPFRSIQIRESNYLSLLKGKPRGLLKEEWIDQRLTSLLAQKHLV
jgi:hypothetical protein